MTGADFKTGDRVSTASGLTRGTIDHVTDEGMIDIKGDSGVKYRNCLPSMWHHIPDAAPDAKIKPLSRGDMCHIMFEIGGIMWHRNGWVLQGRPKELWIFFDDSDAVWVAREWVVRGHGPNPL